MIFYKFLKNIIINSYHKLKKISFTLKLVYMTALLYILYQFPIVSAEEKIIVSGITNNILRKEVNNYINKYNSSNKVNFVGLKNKLLNLLRSNGYYKSKLLIEKTENETIIYFELDEPVIIKNVKIIFVDESVEINDLLEKFLLKDNVKYLKNSILTHVKYEELKRSLLIFLKHNGYLDAKYIKSDLIVDVDNFTADFILELNQGPLFTIDKINYIFNCNLKEEWLIEIEPFRRGCVFNEEVKIKLYEALMSTGLFKNVCITPSNSGKYGKEIDCFCIVSNEKKLEPSVSVNLKSFSSKIKFSWLNICNLAHSATLELFFSQDLKVLKDDFNFKNLFNVSSGYIEYRIPRITFLNLLSVSSLFYISLENKNKNICILNHLDDRKINNEKKIVVGNLIKNQKCIGLLLGFPYLNKKYSLYCDLLIKLEKPNYKLELEKMYDKDFTYFLCFFNLRQGIILNNKKLLSICGGIYGNDYSIKGLFGKVIADFRLLNFQFYRILFRSLIGIELWNYLKQAPSIKYGCLETDNMLMIGYDDYLITSIEYNDRENCIVTAKNRFTISNYLDYLIFNNLKALAFFDVTIFSILKERNLASSLGIGSKYEYSFLCISGYLFYRLPFKLNQLKKSISFIDDYMWFLPSISINVHI